MKFSADLNKGGGALSQGDVEAAGLARGRAVDVLKRMREFAGGETALRLGFGFSFSFRALVLFHRDAAQFKSLRPDWVDAPGPNGRSLMQSWHAAERAICAALQFIDNMGWSRRALVPSANALIVLAAALDKSGLKISGDDEQLYRRWLCLTAMRSVFQASVETTINRFNRAIREHRGSAAEALVATLGSKGSKIKPSEINKYAQPWSPTTLVMYAWLISESAKDWLTNEELNGLSRHGATSLPGGDLTVHHLFPRQLFSQSGERADSANSPSNYALLSRSTNSEFKDKAPSDVFRSLTPSQRSLADAQFFGDGAGDMLALERYEEFCEWRAKRLAESLNRWLGLGSPRQMASKP